MSRTCKEIYVPRIVLSIIWSIVFQLIFIGVFLLIKNVDIYNPITWFEHSVGTVLSLNVFILAVVIFAQGALYSTEYITGLPFHCTRFEMFYSIFSTRNVMLCILHVSIGIMISWIYSSSAGDYYSSLYQLCEEPSETVYGKVCLVERRFLLVLSGVWIGLYYAVRYEIINKYQLFFPFVQQLKLIQVKNNLLPYIKQAMHDAILPTIVFVIAYYLIGKNIRNKFCDILALSTENDSFSIFNLSLIFYLWLHTSLFIVTIRIIRLLFQVHLTEHYEFPIDTSVRPTVLHNNLQGALQISQVSLIQHLAYLDLFLLSESSLLRRKELLTLSQPGGHPYTWDSVIQQCLKLITCFTADLGKVLKNSDNNEDIASVHNSLPVQAHTVRNLTSPQHPCFYKNLTPPLQSNLYDTLIKQFTKYIQDWKTRKIEEFCNKPLILYFFGTCPELYLQLLLAKSQCVVWAAQSLSLLVCASLKEDSYGIAQKDIPDIIVALLQLKLCLDKLQKQIIPIRINHRFDSNGVRMMNWLKSSLKRSLYKIAVNFHLYIRDIQLPSDVEQQMISFATFKEP